MFEIQQIAEAKQAELVARFYHRTPVEGVVVRVPNILDSAAQAVRMAISNCIRKIATMKRQRQVLTHGGAVIR